MPASLSHLSRNHARLVHTFEDGASLTIDYRPGYITPRHLHRTQMLSSHKFEELSESEQAEAMEETTRLLAGILIAWDLLNDHGDPIPATLEGMEDVDYVAQAEILGWIMKDQRLGKSTGTAPSQGSSTPTSASPAAVPTTHSSRRSRTGTPPTKRRSGSV